MARLVVELGETDQGNAEELMRRLEAVTVEYGLGVTMENGADESEPELEPEGEPEAPPPPTAAAEDLEE